MWKYMVVALWIEISTIPTTMISAGQLLCLYLGTTLDLRWVHVCAVWNKIQFQSVKKDAVQPFPGCCVL